jgi:DNA-binding MarR family transcriptional regulator
MPTSDPEVFITHMPGVQYGVLDTLLGYAVRRTQIRMYEDFIASLAPWGITPPRFSAMVFVSLNPGLKLTQLSKIMGIARSGVVMLVDALEALGYMVREPAPEDRRAFSLRLTDKGAQDLQAITAAVQAHDTRVSTLLDKAEQAELKRLLGKLCDADWPTPQPTREA